MQCFPYSVFSVSFFFSRANVAMPVESTSYREYSPWPRWVGWILWGSLAASALPFVFGWDTDSAMLGRLFAIAALLGLGWAIQVLFGGLNARVQETRLFIYMGSIPLIKKSVPFADVKSLESVRYRPIAEFGGWGIRGMGKKKAWTARGNQAVALTLANGQTLYVGSDHPEQLEEHIRRAMAAPAE